MNDALRVWFGSFVHGAFGPAITHYADILLNKVAPLFDDVEKEQERRAQEILASPGWGPDDYDRAMEAAYDESISHAISFMEMRSLYLATGVSGLFHLFEKQVLKHLNHELDGWLVEPLTEWKDAAGIIDKLTHRDGEGDAKELSRNFRNPSLKELRLVANAVKHGKGRAYTSLQTMGARVVDPLRIKDDWTISEFSPLSIPILIEPADIARYRDAILQFWSTEGSYWTKRSAFPPAKA